MQRDMDVNVATEEERKAEVEVVVENPKGEHVSANQEGRALDQYDPFAARPTGQKNTDFAVFMHLLKASIGSGILFLPHAFRQTGYISALVCSVVIGVISCHTAVLTVQCAQILCRRTRRPMLNFAETAGASFQVGPEWIRKYASSFNVTTNVFVCFVQYQTTVIYALYVATSSQQVIEYFTGVALDVRIYIVVFLPVYCALAMVPDFKNLVPFSVAGAIFLAFGFFATLYYLFIDIPNPGRLEAYTGIFSIPIYCGVFLFAVHNVAFLMPLENTMKNPRHMPILVTASMILNICIYMAFGFFGYNKYIDSCDTVIKNLPLDDILAQLVKIAITLSVILTYGLQYCVPVTILWPLIASKIRNDHHYEIYFRLGGVLASTSIALAVPQMAPLLGLFAAVSITTIAVLIPVIIEISTKWYDREDRPSFYIRLIKNAIIILVWLCLLIFGVSENLREIAKHFAGTDEAEAEICINGALRDVETNEEKKMTDLPAGDKRINIGKKISLFILLKKMRLISTSADLWTFYSYVMSLLRNK